MWKNIRKKQIEMDSNFTKFHVGLLPFALLEVTKSLSYDWKYLQKSPNLNRSVFTTLNGRPNHWDRHTFNSTTHTKNIYLTKFIVIVALYFFLLLCDDGTFVWVGPDHSTETMPKLHVLDCLFYEEFLFTKPSVEEMSMIVEMK